MVLHMDFVRELLISCKKTYDIPYELCTETPNFIQNSYGTPYELCNKIPDFMGKIHMVPHMHFVAKLLISCKKLYDTTYKLRTKTPDLGKFK